MLPFLPVCCRDRDERVLAVRTIRDYGKSSCTVSVRKKASIVNGSRHSHPMAFITTRTRRLVMWLTLCFRLTRLRERGCRCI
ncbi:hypothetical protein FQ027_24910 [Escherichia coli]|nr:hypothetical protein [Escherichia coli]